VDGPQTCACTLTVVRGCCTLLGASHSGPSFLCLFVTCVLLLFSAMQQRLCYSLRCHSAAPGVVPCAAGFRVSIALYRTCGSSVTVAPAFAGVYYSVLFVFLSYIPVLLENGLGSGGALLPTSQAARSWDKPARAAYSAGCLHRHAYSFCLRRRRRRRDAGACPTAYISSSFRS
jgi:hypothetical protein